MQVLRIVERFDQYIETFEQFELIARAEEVELSMILEEDLNHLFNHPNLIYLAKPLRPRCSHQIYQRGVLSPVQVHLLGAKRFFQEPVGHQMNSSHLRLCHNPSIIHLLETLSRPNHVPYAESIQILVDNIDQRRHELLNEHPISLIEINLGANLHCFDQVI